MYFTLDRVSRVCSLRVFLSVYLSNVESILRYGVLSLVQYERQGHVGSSQHSTTGYEEGSYHSHNTRGRVMLAVHSIPPRGMRRILSLAQYERQGHVGSSQHSTTGYEEGSYHSHNTRGRAMLAVHSIPPRGMKKDLITRTIREAVSCWQFTAFHHGV
ncbi:hypothetical protein J6590_056807 [Homalodisca vitripennis]|nr:hypothetical protein J6590_056807 [Homalodisca vitripennis]